MCTLIPPFYKYFISNLVLIGQSVLEKEIFEYYGDTHVYYIYPGVGTDQPWGPIFQNHKYSVRLPISFKFFSSNDILTLFPVQMHGPHMLTLS